VVEGLNIHLETRLEPTGDPSMKVEWYCNGRPLTIGMYPLLELDFEELDFEELDFEELDFEEFGFEGGTRFK
jgi:titin